MQTLDIHNPDDRCQIFKNFFEKYRKLGMTIKQASQLAELMVLRYKNIKLMPGEQKRFQQLLTLKNQLNLKKNTPSLINGVF